MAAAKLVVGSGFNRGNTISENSCSVPCRRILGSCKSPLLGDDATNNGSVFCRQIVGRCEPSSHGEDATTTLLGHVSRYSLRLQSQRPGNESSEKIAWSNPTADGARSFVVSYTGGAGRVPSIALSRTLLGERSGQPERRIERFVKAMSTGRRPVTRKCYPARSNRIQPPISLSARPYFKRVGICCTVFFLVMGAFSVFVAATNADESFESPLLAACIFGAFWGAFTLLGIYLWLFSRRYRLTITDDAIEQIGVFTKRRISFRKLQNAKWRNWPQGGSIKLTTPDSRLTIELGTADARDSLIEFLQGRIPVSVQSGWGTFIYNKEQTNAQKSLPPFWLGIIFFLFAVSFVAAWFMGLGGVNLVAAVVNFGLATYAVTRRPQDNKAVNGSRR